MIYALFAAIAAILALRALLTMARRGPAVPMHVHDPTKKRVVVLGGGFAGLYTCAALEKHLRDDFEIVLVNKENHFVFQPLLPEMISGQIGLVDVVSNPIHATGVGLLLYAKSNLEVQRTEAPLLAGGMKTVFERMKAWFQGNF